MLEQYTKLHRLMSLMVSMAERYEPHTTFSDESTAHDALKWRTSQVLIMRKMYARELESVFLDLTDKHSRLDRIRKKTGIETILEPIYESINTTLAMVRQLRRDNGAWFLRVEQYLRSLQFSEQDLKNIFSIADANVIKDQVEAEMFNRFKNAKIALGVS